MKIWLKLILSFLIVASLVGITGFFSIAQSQNALEESIGESTVVLVAETLDKIDRVIHSRANEWALFAENPTLVDFLKNSNSEFGEFEDLDVYIQQQDLEWKTAPKETITPFMKELIDNPISILLRSDMDFWREKSGYSVIGEVVLTNKFGINVAQSGKTTDYYQADKEWWQSAKETGFDVRALEFDESAGIYSLNLSLRSVDSEGNFVGVLKAVLNIEEIINIIKETKANTEYESTNFILLDSKGNVIYDSEGNFELLESIKNKEFYQNITQNKGFFTSKGSNSNETKLFSYARSKGHKDFKGLDWVLVAEYDREEILSPVSTLINSLIFVSLVILVISIFFGLNISMSISRPITTLTKATKKFASGNVEVRANITSDNEIGELADSFNSMTRSVKEYRNRIEKQLNQLKELDKLKGEFISTMSHELKTPLTSMSGFIQLIYEGKAGKTNKEQKEFLRIVIEDIKRLRGSIDKILELSKLKSGKIKFNKKKLGVKESVDRSISVLKKMAEQKNIKLKVEIPEKIPKINCDEEWLDRCLINIIGNAVKFTDKGSITIKASEENNFVVFTISDTGKGLSEKDLAKMFSPFFQSDHTKEGTGLGLVVTQRIIKELGGSISIRSKLNVGTQVKFKLPIE